MEKWCRSSNPRPQEVVKAYKGIFPKVVWYYLSTYVVYIHILVFTDNDERLVMKELLRLHTKISEYPNLHFYDTVKYCETVNFLSDVEIVVKLLWPAKNIGSDLCYKIMKTSQWKGWPYMKDIFRPKDISYVILSIICAISLDCGRNILPRSWCMGSAKKMRRQMMR